MRKFISILALFVAVTGTTRAGAPMAKHGAKSGATKAASHAAAGTVNTDNLSAPVNQRITLEEYVIANKTANNQAVSATQKQAATGFSAVWNKFFNLSALRWGSGIAIFSLMSALAGLLLIGVATEDRKETLKALFGCALGTAVWVTLSSLFGL